MNHSIRKMGLQGSRSQPRWKRPELGRTRLCAVSWSEGSRAGGGWDGRHRPCGQTAVAGRPAGHCEVGCVGRQPLWVSVVGWIAAQLSQTQASGGGSTSSSSWAED